ncbi:23S rRNA (adenine(2030)-N(6))-methyltransferase RlmJ [Solirhodobacter olei]|uniref:23S rRNA (adenine(2030)-N(6))-methyltransferase RlmJ n=1 Tax=Solirhodobacter olei TaxID=2493082 RepID=UPI000FDBB74C|nr:23S rRNA (adenine(2030)-N(6))-methyltransferase RlmJ [Solirhodobacter olei]
MLSYQHLYHAGNLADVHKHAVLAVMLDYLTRKDKPLSYLETHAGRGLYFLDAPEAVKTGEAAGGIARAEVAGWFAADHPYARRLAEVRAAEGATAYPGSPLIAAGALRPGDVMHLAELHPGEFAALQAALPARAGLHLHRQDGLQMALSLAPPMPRRGLMVVDPSYELKSDYEAIPGFFASVARKWNVGVLMLWYPLLPGAPHGPMLAALEAGHPGALRHEVHFPPVRAGHRMQGSGLFIVNPPWGIEEETQRLSKLFG